MLNVENLAALANDRGRLSTGRVRAGSTRRRLTVRLSPLTLTEARAVVAAVPGSKLKRPGASPTSYLVEVRSLAAVAFIDRVVDLLTDSLRSRLSAALDEVDESQSVASRTSSPDRGKGTH